jgi:hypothetical protein
MSTPADKNGKPPDPEALPPWWIVGRLAAELASRDATPRNPWADVLRDRLDHAFAALALTEDSLDRLAPASGSARTAALVADILDGMVTRLVPVIGRAEIDRQAQSRRRSLRPEEARP